jgi:hypothetical protein
MFLTAACVTGFDHRPAHACAVPFRQASALRRRCRKSRSAALSLRMIAASLACAASAAQAAEEVGTDRVEQVIPTQLEAIQPALGLDGIGRSQGVLTVRTA